MQPPSVKKHLTVHCGKQKVKLRPCLARAADILKDVLSSRHMTPALFQEVLLCSNGSMIVMCECIDRGK